MQIERRRSGRPSCVSDGAGFGGDRAQWAFGSCGPGPLRRSGRTRSHSKRRGDWPRRRSVCHHLERVVPPKLAGESAEKKRAATPPASIASCCGKRLRRLFGCNGKARRALAVGLEGKDQPTGTPAFHFRAPVLARLTIADDLLLGLHLLIPVGLGDGRTCHFGQHGIDGRAVAEEVKERLVR